MSHRAVARHRFLRIRTAAAITVSLTVLAACGSDDGGNGGSAEGGSDGGEPVELRLASYAGDNLASVQATQEWTELVTEKTDGAVTFEIFLDGSLIGAPDVYAGVGTGTADLGVESHGYHPAELPLSHAQNVGFVSANSQASAAVQRDFYENNDAFRGEWDAFNLRPLIFGMETSTILGCSEPIDSLDDLEGRNVRAAALMTEDFNSVGANVVGLVAAEMLDAFQRGVIDCWSAVGLALSNDIGLAAITPYVYDYGRGVNGAQQLVINNDVWNSLSDGQREAMTEASDEIFETYFTPEGLQATAALEACDAIEEGGGTLTRLPDDLIEEWEEVAAPANVKRFLEIAGPDGQEFLDQWTESLEAMEEEYSSYEDPTVACAERF